MKPIHSSSISILVAIAILGGCQKPVVTKPDYARKLGPGESALRLVTDPSHLPDFAAAYRLRDVFLLDAIDQSIGWFQKPSSKQFYPFENFTHEQAHASLVAFSQIIQSASNEQAFVDEIMQKFDVYESVGYNNEGIVLFTGYYAPIFKASKTKSAQFTHPLYKRPADLATDPKTGAPLGRKLANGQTVPYYTRAEIEQQNMFAGSELVWLEDSLSAYIVQVNGSAKLRLDDGSEMYIGYAGKTDRPYKGLGQSMMDEGILTPEGLSLRAIRNYYKTNPQKVDELINRNESYVFFTEYMGDKWPAGSLGVKVMPETTLATDKKIYPRGGMVVVDTKAVTLSHSKKDFLRFMLDQDTGGAIQAPGRADIFMGWDPSAEILAGGQYAEGRLYYLFLKPEFVNGYTHAPAPKKAPAARS